ncbi:MAG: DNA internalization-related competence protein ComEC/Rec2 [Bacteroidota bacterium]
MPAATPLLWPALCLIAGIWAGFRVNPAALPYCITAVLLLFLLLVINGWRRSKPFSLALLQQTVLLWLLVGGIGVLRAVHTTHKNVQSAALLSQASDQEVFILGHVQTIQRTGRFTIIARRLYVPSKPTAIHSKLQVVIEAPNVTVSAGQHLILRGFVQQPAGARNPGAFDYRAYLVQQNITHVFHANKYAPLPISTTRKWTTLVGRLQQHLTAYLHRYIEDEAVRAVLFALLLGDSSALPAETRDEFQQTGLMHLLAVSGLHVMLVGMVVYECLQPICLRMGCSWRAMMMIRMCVVTAVLMVYLLITGAKPPVVRAVFMTTLMMAGQQIQRPTSSINLLSFAAIILLLIKPSHLFSAGFQLSFAAVLGILLFTPHFKRLLPPRYTRSFVSRYAAESILVSVSASLATLPVLLYHFSYVPISGIVLNLAALPLTAATLSAGICMLLAAAIYPPLAVLLSYTVTWSTQCLLTVVNKGAQVAFSIAPGTPDVPLLVFLVVCLLLLPRLLSHIYRWRAVAVLGIAVNLLLWTGLIAGKNQPRLTVTFFDVGHGDASLISFPNNKHMLVDTGGFIKETPIVERVLLPYLRVAGINTLDAVLLSHPHQDHAGGLPALLSAIPVNRVLTAPDTSFIRYLSALQPGMHQTILAGDTLLLDHTARISILAPDAKLNTHVNPNVRSLFFQLQYGNTGVLFTGDATAVTEQFVIQHFPAFLHGHIVKVPHHGSETSSTRALLETLKKKEEPPSIAVISTAAQHRYGLPDEVVVRRWMDVGAQIHNTATDGALVITSDGTQMTVLSY